MKTIPPISTTRIITFHLNSLNIKKTMIYDEGNSGPGLGQAQKCDRVKPLNEIPAPPLDNLIDYDVTILKSHR
jgi:hypothetical protein